MCGLEVLGYVVVAQFYAICGSISIIWFCVRRKKVGSNTVGRISSFFSPLQNWMSLKCLIYFLEGLPNFPSSLRLQMDCGWTQRACLYAVFKRYICSALWNTCFSLIKPNSDHLVLLSFKKALNAIFSLTWKFWD